MTLFLWLVWCNVLNIIECIWLKHCQICPKWKKALFCLSRLVLCFSDLQGKDKKKKKRNINDLFKKQKASKRLRGSCPTAYMFNDAHQNLAFHYLNIKLELHEHPPWLLRIMFKHATKYRWVDSKWRPQRQCQGTTFHVLPLGNWYSLYI